jgi:hypothetical protein
LNAALRRRTAFARDEACEDARAGANSCASAAEPILPTVADAIDATVAAPAAFRNARLLAVRGWSALGNFSDVD